MKKLMMVVALGLLAQGAWADDRGASTGSESGANRGEACERAKRNADNHARVDGGLFSVVTGHGGCDCGKDEKSTFSPWTCTVDAYWEKKKN